MKYLFCQVFPILCSIIPNPFLYTINLQQTILKTSEENMEHRYKWKTNIQWKWKHCGIMRNFSLCAIPSFARGFSHFVWCKFLKYIFMLEKVKHFGNQYWLRHAWLVGKDQGLFQDCMSFWLLKTLLQKDKLLITSIYPFALMFSKLYIQ